MVGIEKAVHEQTPVGVGVLKHMARIVPIPLDQRVDTRLYESANMNFVPGSPGPAFFGAWASRDTGRSLPLLIL